jgi:hypothetical protein
MAMTITPHIAEALEKWVAAAHEAVAAVKAEYSGRGKCSQEVKDLRSAAHCAMYRRDEALRSLAAECGVYQHDWA